MAAETTQTYNTLLTKTINKILSKTTEHYETAVRDFIELGIDINDTFYRVYEFGGTRDRVYQRDDTFIAPEYPYTSRFDYRGIPPPKFKETCILFAIDIRTTIKKTGGQRLFEHFISSVSHIHTK